MKLNIYKSKTEIEKTYTAEIYDLLYGTLEDFINIIDLDRITNGKNADFVSAVSIAVVKGMSQLKPLILDVFDGLTEEELRKTRVSELTAVVIEILKYAIAQIGGASTGKNA